MFCFITIELPLLDTHLPTEGFMGFTTQRVPRLLLSNVDLTKSHTLEILNQFHTRAPLFILNHSSTSLFYEIGTFLETPLLKNQWIYKTKIFGLL